MTAKKFLELNKNWILKIKKHNESWAEFKKKKNYSRRKGEIMRKKEKERRDKEKVE